MKAVQQALIDLGFSLPGGADGAFGKQSAKAVRNAIAMAYRLATTDFVHRVEQEIGACTRQVVS